MNVAHRSRIYLIRLAKVFPFILCGIIAISFVDCLRSLILEDYAIYDGYTILNTPINWFIARYYEYGIYAIIVAIILSLSAETCIYNKLGILYAIINYIEKYYFTFEMDVVTIYTIVILNIAISGYLTLQGIKRL